MKFRWPWRSRPSEAIVAYQRTLLTPEAIRRAHAAYKEASGYFYRDREGLRHESAPGRVYTQDEASMVSLRAAVQALLELPRT